MTTAQTSEVATIEIKRWDTGEVIYVGHSVSDAVENDISLFRADLEDADLTPSPEMANKYLEQNPEISHA